MDFTLQVGYLLYLSPSLLRLFFLCPGYSWKRHHHICCIIVQTVLLFFQRSSCPPIPLICLGRCLLEMLRNWILLFLEYLTIYLLTLSFSLAIHASSLHFLIGLLHNFLILHPLSCYSFLFNLSFQQFKRVLVVHFYSFSLCL